MDNNAMQFVLQTTCSMCKKLEMIGASHDTTTVVGPEVLHARKHQQRMKVNPVEERAKRCQVFMDTLVHDKQKSRVLFKIRMISNSRMVYCPLFAYERSTTLFTLEGKT